MKSDMFLKELNYIKDENIKKSTKVLLDMLPDYFYNIAASSTGKYHPTFSLGDKGLVRHVKASVRIAIELFNDESIHKFSSIEQDLILMSLILHDGLKKGLVESDYTSFNHPVIMAKFICDNKDKLFLSDEYLMIITNAISSHMGPWNTDKIGNTLPLPSTALERFVHMCDYLSSRRFLDIKFINNEIE